MTTDLVVHTNGIVTTAGVGVKSAFDVRAFASVSEWLDTQADADARVYVHYPDRVVATNVRELRATITPPCRYCGGTRGLCDCN